QQAKVVLMREVTDAEGEEADGIARREARDREGDDRDADERRDRVEHPPDDEVAHRTSAARRGRPTHWSAPSRIRSSLFLDPPFVHVVDRAEGAGLEVLQRLLRDGKHVVRVAEVVRLVLVEDLVERLVLLLAGR